MIVGLLGQAGSGKDAVADFMVKNHGFAKVAFADPLKRICRDVFDFSFEQLWGQSEKRNEPDPRWPHKFSASGVAAEYLTPRHALQQLGTEWGRHCSPNVWVEYALRVATRILANPGGNPTFYDPRLGIRQRYVSDPEIRGVVISDVRFFNEVRLLKKADAKVVRIVRKNNMKSLEGAAGAHVSETEQQSLPDELFDYHLTNGGDSLALLEAAVAGLVETIRG